jgi:hypothetical protein
MQAARFIVGHRRLLTLSEFAAGERDEADICVRHDVDNDLPWALAFARWEAEQGIRATYFILPTAPYWLSAHLPSLAIQALGHEVGVHNDALVACEGNVEGALNKLRDWGDEMRSWGIDVRGIADHGGSETINNTDLWRVHNHAPTAAGYEYEAYLCHQQGANYISDNQGLLRAPLADRPGRQTHILQHPCHWELPE